MPRRTPMLLAVPAAVSLAMTALWAAAVQGQARGPAPLTRPQFGLGYVANAPEAMAGGSAYVVIPRWGGVGLYVDAKFDVSNPSDEKGYDPTVTSAVVRGTPESKFLQSEETWKSFNVAVVRPLTPFLMGYLGGGLAKVREYDLYAAPQDFPYGLSGVIWALNPPADATRLNIMAGMMMRMTARVTGHFGFETRPGGVTVGLSLRLPPW